MTFEWNAHRFSGGHLALDLVNTVVHRKKGDKRIDRLESLERVEGFAVAAGQYRIEELGRNDLLADRHDGELPKLIELREAIYEAVRPDNDGSPADAKALHRLFDAAAHASENAEKRSNGMSLGLACALSAMRLLDPAARRTVKACPNCDWLFLDRSRNGSRRWCDMAICGNRAKAGAHYKRKLAMARQGEDQ